MPETSVSPRPRNQLRTHATGVLEKMACSPLALHVTVWVPGLLSETILTSKWATSSSLRNTASARKRSVRRAKPRLRSLLAPFTLSVVLATSSAYFAIRPVVVPTARRGGQWKTTTATTASTLVASTAVSQHPTVRPVPRPVFAKGTLVTTDTRPILGTAWAVTTLTALPMAIGRSAPRTASAFDSVRPNNLVQATNA
jgi:hypothetical protein